MIADYDGDPDTTRYQREGMPWRLIAFLVAAALGLACVVRWWP